MRLLLTAWALAGLLMLNGCASYTVGPEAAATPRNVAILPIRQQALVPQASQPLHHNLGERLLRHTPVALADEARADALVQITLLSYDREETTERREDTGLGFSFGLTLTARVELLDAATREPLRPAETFQAYERVVAPVNLPQTEANTIPLLARSLAEDIADWIAYPW